MHFSNCHPYCEMRPLHAAIGSEEVGLRRWQQRIFSNYNAPSFLDYSCYHSSIQGSRNQCKAKIMTKKK
ncbi:hypothetical protein QL285_014406 [Trifolium repens]|nr:hypothetical protein QL285_014406 [Trifolium repens]